MTEPTTPEEIVSLARAIELLFQKYERVQLSELILSRTDPQHLEHKQRAGAAIHDRRMMTTASVALAQELLETVRKVAQPQP